MPFKSKSQISTCYGKQDSRWNCGQWLRETPSVCCLPYKTGGEIKSRCLRKGERIIGKIQTGSRGGRYFTITEKEYGRNGNKKRSTTLCTVKVYLPRKK